MQGTALQILNWVNRVMWGIVWKGFIGTSLNIIFMMYSFRFMTRNEKNLFPFSVPQKEKKRNPYYIITLLSVCLSVCQDRQKGIKIYRVFSVDLELWNLASNTVLYYKYREKSENYTFAIKS